MLPEGTIHRTGRLPLHVYVSAKKRKRVVVINAGAE